MRVKATESRYGTWYDTTTCGGKGGDVRWPTGQWHKAAQPSGTCGHGAWHRPRAWRATRLPGEQYLRHGPRTGGPFVASSCARTARPRRPTWRSGRLGFVLTWPCSTTIFSHFCYRSEPSGNKESCRVQYPLQLLQRLYEVLTNSLCTTGMPTWQFSGR
jgi:hypothetical protein